MNVQPEKPVESNQEDILVRFRRQNEKAWRQILSMTDVLDKQFVELSLAGDDLEGCDPYDSSTRLRRLSA